MKNLFKKIKKNKKTSMIIAGLAIILIIILIVVLVLPKRDGGEPSIKNKEENQTQIDASKIILKEVEVLKDTELSKNILDYIDYIPNDINTDELSLDTSDVDTKVVGDYSFIVNYNETKVSGTIHVVDNEEEVEDKDTEDTKTPTESENKTENKKPATTTTSTTKKPSSSSSNTKDKEETTEESKENNSSNTTTEEEQPKALTGTRIDRNIVSYDYGLTTERISSDIVFYSLPDYHGEFWYTFAKPVVLDVYGHTSLTNWGFKLAETIVSYGLEIAKKEFGEDSLYCVKDYDKIFAKNQYEDVVAVIAKYTIGKKDEFDSCSIDNKTVYANNRIAVKHDIENFMIVPE